MEQPNPSPLRVVLAEDEGLYRDMLRAALGQDPTIEVVGAFADGDALLAGAAALRPDVALLDIELGSSINGVQAGLRLRQQLPDLGIVLLSNLGAPRFLAALKPEQIAGWAYLLKRSARSVDVLRRAIHGASMGLVMLDPHLVAGRTPQPGGPLARLTPRQHQMVELLAEGLSNEAIADRLGVSPRTVDNQIGAIYDELGVDRADAGVQPRVKAVLLYLQETQQIQGLREPTPT